MPDITTPLIIKFANEYVVTDLSLNDMMTLFGFAKDLKENQIETAMLPIIKAQSGRG